MIASTIRRFVLSSVFVLLFMCMFALGGSLTTDRAAQPLPSKLHPQLAQRAAAHPDETIAVIAQRSAPDAPLAAEIAMLGGHVTKDLRIIDALAAELTGREVLELARSESVAVLWPDALAVQTGCPPACKSGVATVEPSGGIGANLQSVYPLAVNAPRVWNEHNGANLGQGIGVAVVDSGMAAHPDFGQRVIASIGFQKKLPGGNDNYGHGTHIAGIIGGDGAASHGAYMGIAPQVNLINVRVSDARGESQVSEVIEGLQWVNDHRAAYNIRVVNLSLNSSLNQSYHKDPLDAAVEILWFNRIVVVVSAGNNGKSALYAPANDPFVIAVGAVNDQSSATTLDDEMPAFSAWGKTIDGFSKPDVLAPGVGIVSTLASGHATIAVDYPERVVGPASAYFRMSGTSVAAPIVSGVAALMLQAQPQLTPDQVKQCLKSTLSPIRASGRLKGAGVVNTYAAVHCTSDASANIGLVPSHLLSTGTQPIGFGGTGWNAVNWSAVNWSSVNWSSVNWSSVNWSSVNWSSVDWSQ